MGKTKLTKLGEWARAEFKDAYRRNQEINVPLWGLAELIDILIKEPAPELPLIPVRTWEEQLAKPILADEPKPKPEFCLIPVRACEVCGTACGAAHCVDCKRDARTLQLAIGKASYTYLYNEHVDNPDLEGFDHAYADAKRAYLRRIEKRKEAK